MSTLSKVFVVLNFLLAISFMIATLTLYSKKVNWVQESVNNAIERNQLKSKLDEQVKLYNDETTKLVQIINEKKEKVAELDADLRQTKDQLAQQQQQNQQLQTEVRGIRTEIGKVQTTLTELEERNRQLQQDVEQMRQERDKAVAARDFAETQAIEVMADLKEAEAELLQLSKQNYALVDEVMQKDVLLEEARKRGFNPQVLFTGDIGTGVPIAGRILQVEEAVGIVILNVGKKDKVKAGMEFTVSRGDKYIGKVRVRNIYEDMSSAVILRPLTKAAIEEADLVQTM